MPSSEGAVIVDAGDDVDDDGNNALVEVGDDVDFLVCARCCIHICFLGKMLSDLVNLAALIAWGTSSTGAFRVRFTAFATFGSLGSFAVPLPAMFVTC